MNLIFFKPSFTKPSQDSLPLVMIVRFSLYCKEPPFLLQPDTHCFIMSDSSLYGCIGETARALLAFVYLQTHLFNNGLAIFLATILGISIKH